MKKRTFLGAFSLAELLAVLGILVLVAGFTVPAVYQSARASRLTVTGKQVMDELNLARQKAISHNTSVEVRFYLLAEDQKPNSVLRYRGMQSFLAGADRVEPLDKVEYFATPVILSPGSKESPLLNSQDHPELAGPSDLPLGEFGEQYRYRALRFAPDGSADVSNEESFFTLILQNDKSLQQGGNFFTIQIDPISGAVRHFRP